mgnify:CR=1 FL=1
MDWRVVTDLLACASGFLREGTQMVLVLVREATLRPMAALR